MAVNVASPLRPSHYEIIWLAGPRLIGLFFNWALLGVVNSQTYIYFLSYPEDRRLVKFLVYGTFILDWVQTISATYDGFQWFVYGWGDAVMLYQLHTSYLNVPALSSIVGAAVQLFYGWRVWSLSKSPAIYAVIITLVLLQLSGSAGVAFYMFTNPSEVSRSKGLVRAVWIRLSSNAVVDTVIAGTMTYYLLKCKERATGQTNNVLTNLIRLTIETGSMTAFASIVDLAFVLSQKNGLHEVTGVILGKLYSVMLLVFLNNRVVIHYNMHRFGVLFPGDLNSVHSSSHQLVVNNRSHTKDLEMARPYSVTSSC